MMQRYIPSQTALVLGGGGAKGSYEVGVIEALDHLGIRAGSVYGTSIGSLNAAMYALGDVTAVRTLWENIRIDDVVTPESVALAEEAEAVFVRPDKLLDFITRNAHKKGIDPAPLFELIKRYVNEPALRESRVRFGLVTTRFPSLAAVEKRIEDMPPGTVADYLMASCACFPVMPMRSIAGDRYMDGGFSDNVPVEMALRQGARHVIAVDIGRHRTHDQYERRPNVTYIRAAHSLGGLLTFDAERAKRNMVLGYNDTLRAFGMLRGTRYSFDRIDAQRLAARADDFVYRLSVCEAGMAGHNSAPLFGLLEESLRPGADAIDYFLRACELCAETLGVDPTKVYTFDAFREAIFNRLPLEEAQQKIGSLLGGRIGVLFAPPQPDRRFVLACLTLLLRREGAFSALAMRTLSAFPHDLLCALTLRELG